jgi:hypothetical protein
MGGLWTIMIHLGGPKAEGCLNAFVAFLNSGEKKVQSFQYCRYLILWSISTFVLFSFE